LLPTPEQYGFAGKSFFFKPSLNCVFNCTYCYLQGTFANRFPVIFVNYEEMQTAIDEKINQVRAEGYAGQITFYASNYADLLAIEHRTHFHQHFIPFFERYEDVLMETRTKSANIHALQQLPPAKNTEIAFSLSPEMLAQAYEHGTASLAQKLQAIQELLQMNSRVGLRFLPLLPVENYQEVYGKLIQQVQTTIDVSRLSSICIAPLLYSPADFVAISKQHPAFPFLTTLQPDEQGLMKMDTIWYERFYQLFSTGFPEHTLVWDYR
jgi:spore photoproduct lyase